MLWIPLNHHAMEAGVDDSRDDGVAYLDALAPGQLDADALTGFLDSGPETIRYLADRTPVRLRPFLDFPDYQSEAIGARSEGGCSLDNDVFPFEDLGSWATRVNPPKTGIPKLLSRIEDRHGGLTDEQLADRAKRDGRGQGQALIGSLLRACWTAASKSSLTREAESSAPRTSASSASWPTRTSPAPDTGAQGRRHCDGRLRVEQEARPGVPARTDDGTGERPGMRGRRTAHGDGGRREPRQHGERVVDGFDQGIRRHQPRHLRQPPVVPGRTDVPGLDGAVLADTCVPVGRVTISHLVRDLA